MLLYAFLPLNSKWVKHAEYLIRNHDAFHLPSINILPATFSQIKIKSDGTMPANKTAKAPDKPLSVKEEPSSTLGPFS